MFTCSTAIDVQRPIGEVFAFVADARNRPRWDDSVDSEELTSAEPIGVGTTVRTKLRSMGRGYSYDWKVTEYQPPRRMTIESTAGPLPTTLVYELVEGERGTRVRFTVRGRPGGVMRLLQPLLARTTQRNLDHNFPRLQRLLDRGADGAAAESRDAETGAPESAAAGQRAHAEGAASGQRGDHRSGQG